MTDTTQGYGQLAPPDTSSEFNRMAFLVSQALARVRTVVLVKVKETAADGSVAAPGTVNVQPLVSMTDGQGNATPHGTIFNIPIFRVQGGSNAIILDPAVDDIGWMAVCDRDISSVKATSGEVSTPGSLRRFDMADGVYLGGLFGETPTQYVRFSADGVDIVDKNGHSIDMRSDGIHVTGKLFITGDVEQTGNMTISGSIHAATAAITGAITAASMALTGALTALSAAITNLLAGGSVSSGSTVTATTNLVAADMLITGHVSYSTHRHGGVTGGNANTGVAT